jgi:hypothetical protein
VCAALHGVVADVAWRVRAGPCSSPCFDGTDVSLGVTTSIVECVNEGAVVAKSVCELVNAPPPVLPEPAPCNRMACNRACSIDADCTSVFPNTRCLRGSCRCKAGFGGAMCNIPVGSCDGIIDAAGRCCAFGLPLGVDDGLCCTETSLADSGSGVCCPLRNMPLDSSDRCCEWKNRDACGMCGGTAQYSSKCCFGRFDACNACNGTATCDARVTLRILENNTLASSATAMRSAAASTLRVPINAVTQTEVGEALCGKMLCAPVSATAPG